MRTHVVKGVIGGLLGFALALPGSVLHAQNRDPLREFQAQAAERMRQERLQAFIEDTFRLYEISGELVAFRVLENPTSEDLALVDRRARELDEEAGRLISFIRSIAPGVRGNTDNLWVIFNPPDENSTLEERLTLMLALVNGVAPKIQHLIDVLTEEGQPAIEVEDLMVEASLPYFIVGGLEELRSLTRELRQSL